MNLVVITPSDSGFRVTVNDELVAILQDETAAVNFANALQSGPAPSVAPEGRWSTAGECGQTARGGSTPPAGSISKEENQGHGRPLILKGEA